MCGLIGVLARDQSDTAADVAVNLLLRLQHRGQDGAGISLLRRDGHFEVLRGLGLIEHALKEWPQMGAGFAAIAHTRYATTGTGGLAELQPFIKGSPKLAMAHNGNIVNTEALIKSLGLAVETQSDLDVLQQAFLKVSIERGFEAAVQTIFDNFNGSYAVAGLEDNGLLFGFRDPFGIRPLFLGLSPKIAVLASETTALDALKYSDPDFKVTELEAGEWVQVTSTQIKRGRLKSKINPKSEKRFCMFENIYFASPQSEMGHQSVYRMRFRLGQMLAQEMLTRTSWTLKSRVDCVVPVPDTSRVAALAVAETIGVPYREFLVKNSYVARTFILSSQDRRLKALSQKLSLIGPEIKGQRILLVDDSIVRGNTSRMMAMRLREAGAQTVLLSSTCPPIRNGCFYGIDFPDPDELVAFDRSEDQIAKSLGVDELFYISDAALAKSFESENLCKACIDGNYPTFDESFDVFLKNRREARRG